MNKPYGHINSKHSVCMNCGDRRIGCHGICKDYCEEVANAVRFLLSEEASYITGSVFLDSYYYNE